MEGIEVDKVVREKLGYVAGGILRPTPSCDELIINAGKYGIQTLKQNPSVIGYNERRNWAFTDRLGSLEIMSEVKLPFSRTQR